jgi:uncharacterized surface protein with fasciclin (FAS1) repeats
MNRLFLSRPAFIAACAALPLLAACSSMASMSDDTTKAPAQTSQNPARQMHYSQASAQPVAMNNATGNPWVGGAEMFPTKTIAENAMNSADHTTLIAAVKAADLGGTLMSPGPFTVFAPTNEAFAALPAGTVDTLLKPENKPALTRVLTCHVVAGKVTAADLSNWIDKNGGSYTLKTVGGCPITATKNNGKVWLTDAKGGKSTVTIADVMQSNGVVHVVDEVLLPRG